MFPLEMDPEKEDKLREGLDKGQIKSAVFHAGEGVDAAAAREFKMLNGQKLLRKEVVVVHATAATPADFEMLASNEVGLVWSPRSNIELYGQTTDVAAAKAKGVQIAIAPDWSVSGSNGMLDEMNYAWRWGASHGKPFSAEELLQAATIVPATLAGAEQSIGSIAKGKAADLLVVDDQRGKSPYASVVTTKPAGVRLVIVGGRPMFGRTELLSQIEPSAKVEDVMICGQKRGLDLSNSDNGKGATLKGTSSVLEAALKKHGLGLAPLADC